MERNNVGLTTALLIIGTLVLANSGVNANPTISNAAVSLGPAEATIVVDGSNFGSQGPRIVIYDSFEDPAESQGQWTDGNINSESVARTGSKSHRGLDQDTFYQLEKDLGGSYDEIFLSYWVRLGTDYFPGSSKYSATGPNEFPDNSSWKFAWIMDGNRGYERNNKFDLCLPTHTGSGTFQLAGNDGVLERIDNSWWSWDGWIRISTLIRRQSGDYGFFQTVSAEHGMDTIQFGNNSPFFSGVTGTFDFLTLPGWSRDSNEAVKVYYDDVYVAVGAGAPARIEIANASNYSDATIVDIAKTITWSDGRISATLPTSSGLEISGDGFLFVVDAMGRRNSVGYPLCEECPEPPLPR